MKFSVSEKAELLYIIRNSIVEMRAAEVATGVSMQNKNSWEPITDRCKNGIYQSNMPHYNELPEDPL